ncbi:MAG: DUF3520 domain-containing protein [Planctomycetes bacterium]|nr:DUF3520 domain-containing protein [Planctomycetota bacterium]
MCDERSEQHLDAELRNVEVPGELFARAKQVTQLTDAAIDSAICSLETPNGLATRVRIVVADASLDESIRLVEVPEDLLASLRIIPEVRRDSTLRRFVLAASLLLAMTGSFFGALGGLMASLRPVADAATSLYVIDVGPTQLMAMPSDPVRISSDKMSSPFEGRTVPVVWKGGPLQVDLVRIDATMTPGPAGQLIREVERGLELGRDVLLMRWDAYASPQHASQRLPELEQIRRPPRAGVDLPMVAGYDRSFLQRSSTHPPVFIAGQEVLKSIRVPLSTSVASVRRTEQLLKLDRVPDAQEIRTEDFLAVVDYGFAPPNGNDVSVTIMAGPAVFGDQDHSLVQVGVKAARRLGDSATHLSVVVDVSQSMRQQRHIDVVRDSLRTMFEHLGPGDSISLIAVNHEVTQQLDFATSEQQDLVSDWLAALRAGGGDRLAVGVQAGLSLALESPFDDSIAKELVVVTDGAARSSRGERAQLSELLRVAAESGVQATVLQLGDDTTAVAPSVDGSPTPEGGLHLATVSSDELSWKLVELVTGVSSVVARQALVHVEFNPKAVRAYRLIGHGPLATTGLGEEVWATDLRSAEEATLLFEVWLRDSLGDEIASATMHWIAPESSEAKHSGVASLSRYGVTTRLSEAPASLQAAAIAAEIGQRFRGTGSFELGGEAGFRERRKSASWAGIMDAAAHIAPEVAGREEFQRLLELARKMEEQRRHQRASTTL